MSSPVVVARIPSATQADQLALYLRSQGIAAVSRTMLDRTAYPSLGGATVLVPASQRVEAELELMLIEQSRVEMDQAPADRTGFDDNADGAYESDEDLDGTRPARGWVRAASWVALAAMATMAVVPSIAIIWRTLGL